MKRKFSQINNCMTIKKVKYLLCEICSKKVYTSSRYRPQAEPEVYTYQQCQGNYIYCSQDCLEILVLSNKNDYIDVKSKVNSFKRSEKSDNLMELDDDNLKE